MAKKQMMIYGRKTLSQFEAEILENMLSTLPLPLIKDEQSILRSLVNSTVDTMAKQMYALQETICPYGFFDGETANLDMHSNSVHEPKPEVIHSTVGVYPNWKNLGRMGYKVNGVLDQYLKGHLEYNLQNRPGRALFVNGRYLQGSGHLPPQEIAYWEELIQNDPEFKMTKDTSPYV